MDMVHTFYLLSLTVTSNNPFWQGAISGFIAGILSFFIMRYIRRHKKKKQNNL